MIIKGEDTIFLLFVLLFVFVVLVVVSLLFFVLFCLLFWSEWICFVFQTGLRYPSMHLTNFWCPITSHCRNLFNFDPLCWVFFVNRMSVLHLGQWTTAVFFKRRV